MEFLFFVGFPIITFFLGLAFGYIYANQAAVKTFLPMAEELNRRIDQEVLRIESSIHDTQREMGASEDRLWNALANHQSTSTKTPKTRKKKG